VALEARAEERETRGLTSMTRILAVLHCELDIAAALFVPRARMMLMAALRSIWISRVGQRLDGRAQRWDCAVWMPIGSMFSMLQMVMQVSLRVPHRLVLHRSIQPPTLSSRRTW